MSECCVGAALFPSLSPLRGLMAMTLPAALRKLCREAESDLAESADTSGLSERQHLHASALQSSLSPGSHLSL